jgi:hypothetical protein
MQSVFSAASRRTNSQGEQKGLGRDGALKTLCIMEIRESRREMLAALAKRKYAGQSIPPFRGRCAGCEYLLGCSVA